MKAAASYQIDSDPTEAWSTRLLFQAAKLGDAAAVETLLAEGANINAVTSEGTTPLMMAASFGQLAILRLLQERGANINQTQGDGFSALTLAVFFGHEAVVRELLTLGADLNASRGQMTPEMWATARGFPIIAELLKERWERLGGLTEARVKEPSQVATSDSKTMAAAEVRSTASTSEELGFFEEGIRRVGQTDWTTTAQTSKSEQRVLSALKTSDKWRKRTSHKENTSAQSILTDRDRNPAAFVSLGEGIRRVGQTNWTTADPCELTDYYPKVAVDSFSPFSTLSERLGLRWKDVGLVGILVVALSVLGAVLFFQQREPEPQQVSETPAGAPAPAPSIQTQQLNDDAPTAQFSVAAAPEQSPSPEAVQSPSVVEPSRDYGATEGPIQKPLTREASLTVGNPDIAKSLASNRRTTTGSPTSNHRQKRAVRSSKKVEKIEEVTAPAAITIVPSQPPKRTLSAPNATTSQPATLIEGSSNKKKVIQWP